MVPALMVYGVGGLICGFAALTLRKPYYLLLFGRAVQGRERAAPTSWPWPSPATLSKAVNGPKPWDCLRPPMGWGKC